MKSKELIDEWKEEFLSEFTVIHYTSEYIQGELRNVVKHKLIKTDPLEIFDWFMNKLK